ncbi:uncharacterized protein [Solanum lycopersicum]|uniref:uncharacterized protein n=1 Tax=Solanum lycopersicum TaxID=4081 RepID=UPI003747C255
MDASLEVGTFPRLTTGSVMTGDQHELFIKFLNLKPPVFKGAESVDAYYFLVDCHELLHKMDIVERFGVEFVTYQFQGDAKMWWRSYVECQPARAPPMTWASFSRLFMEKYIPRTLRDRRRDEFLSLDQGRMYVAAYEAKFRAPSRGQTSGGYPARRIQSSLQASAGGPSQTIQPFSEFGGSPDFSYRTLVVKGRGGHGRGRHSGGRGDQGNGGHQFCQGGGQVGTTAAQLGRGNRQTGDTAHCYAFPERYGAETSDSVITDCNAKTVTLAKPGTDPLAWEGEYISTPVRIISRLRAKRMVSKGYLAFLAHLKDDTSKVPSIESVSIVREFLDVFPVDLPGMPPDRDIDFCIDLESDTRPISIPPYRMASAELRELKAQLQELLSKGFIRPSVSPLGAPVLFVKKKDGSFRMCID